LQRNDEETIKAYKIRLCKNKELYELTWPNIVDLLADEGETIAERSLRGWWTAYLEGITDSELSNSDDNYLKECELKKQEWQKEKMKVQTEKLDLNRRLRETARVELYFEKIEEAIAELKPIPVPHYENIPHTSKEGLCIIADAHYGSQFQIRGLRGEIMNEYSPEIFEQRMWELCGKMKTIVEKEGIEKLIVLDLADALEGLLHVNQLLTLRYGLVDSTLKYSEFIATWLNELSKCCLVEYRNTNGNHTETRPFNSKRGEFPDENVERIIAHIIGLRLEKNKRVTVHDTDMTAMYFQCNGLNIVGCHGQNEKNIDNTVSDYINFYHIDPDIVFEGHLHRQNSKTVSSKQENDVRVIQCPSIIGINPYSATIKKGAKAGAIAVTFSDGMRQMHEIQLN
jgi:predicted phosphodiesterase